MTTMASPPLPGKQRRKLADWLLEKHPLHSALPFQPPPFGASVVCISDTQNQQPKLPPGDILIHAGNLTENGTFPELQEQINWLSSQPHLHKIVIAGSKDVLLDDEFMQEFPEFRGQDTRTREQLNWGTVKYLQDSSTTLRIIPRGYGDDPNTNGTVMSEPIAIKVYGSPRIPKRGVQAFQYPPDKNVWKGQIPDDIDVLVCHGPPQLHLDGEMRAGCPFLAREIASKKPRLVVFGHVQSAYGREDVLFDKSMYLRDEAVRGTSGWGKLLGESVDVGFARLKEGLRTREKNNVKAVQGQPVTTLVNAAIGGGEELQNAILVDI